LGISFQGILPGKKNAIATALGKTIAKEFDVLPLIEKKINDPATLESILPLIESHIDIFLNQKLKEEMPMISMFIGSKTTDKLKDVFLKEIQALFPQVISKFAGNIGADLDIEKIVTQKITALTPHELEARLKPAMQSELRAIKRLGAVSGFIIGVIQVIILLIVSCL